MKSKMAYTRQQYSWCVLEFAKINSVVSVLHTFRRKFHVDPPTKKYILKW